MRFDEAMAALEGLEVHGIELGLDRIRRLLSGLGDPHKRLSSVHIAGTNGKGSTAAYIVAALREAGCRTGLYTSPHLSRFTERITISGQEISEEKVADLAERVFALIQDLGPGFKTTFFEVTTAMAFLYFADEAVDLAVIETGLGGRLDATNVLMPRVSVITNVALEHTDYLGDTVEAIAREKGGIIKPGVEVVTGERNPGILGVIQDICERQGSRLIALGHDFSVSDIILDRSDGSRRFHYSGEQHRWDHMAVGMLGNHQVVNAAVALGTLEVLIAQGVAVDEGAVRRGLAAARWPGRMEIMSHDPLVIVDGAHNPHAAAALTTTLEKDLRYRRLILVVGILNDKDIPAVINPLLPLADRLVLTRPRYVRGADPRTVASRIGQTGIPVSVAGTIPEAIEEALSFCVPDDLLLITGSLYTVGEARDHLLTRESSASWS